MVGLEIYLLAADNPIGHEQRRIFKRKRAGEVLTREQVKAIKKGRRLLRKQMKAQGLTEKSDFELTATNLGLYFDKRRWRLWFLWYFHGKALWTLIGAAVLLLGTLFLYASVTSMRGHFTINMSDGLFKEGFVLADNEDFENATTHLFCEPAVDVPNISISHLPQNIDTIDGQHNADYFAYTFYCRNEGQSTVDYNWQVNLNSESLNLSEAVWVMVFEDGEMAFYAKPNQYGEIEALPSYDDDTRGYIGAPMMQFAADPMSQYQKMASRPEFDYYRVIPLPFESETMVCKGYQKDVDPMEVHKYTVVIWLEGDDPDCTDDLIGGHIGMDFYIQLVEEENAEKSGWDKFWENLKFWK